ncbi:amidophosphoribosyltransferase [Patescibacteria group bacterium]
MAGGVIGVSVNKELSAFKDFSMQMFYATHLGSKFSGLSCIDTNGEFITEHNKGRFRKNQKDGKFNVCHGELIIGHTALKEKQPLEVDCQWGKFALTFSGNISNINDLRKQFSTNGSLFITNRDVEIMAKIVAKGKNSLDGLKLLYKQVQGAFSLLVLTKDGIYCARSSEGQTALVLGKKKNNIVVSSTTTGFSNGEYGIDRDIKPGEVVLLKNGDIEKEYQITESSKIQCPTFRWIYSDDPSSTIEGVNVAEARISIGRELAKLKPVKADYVMAVPNSGIYHATGYCLESKIPYMPGLQKYQFADRSYSQTTQEERDEEAYLKILVIERLVKGKSVIVVDDSIVRATQMKMNLIKKLRNAGVKEIHLRIACPPITKPCRYDFATRSLEELATYKYGGPDKIKEFLEVDSLVFATKEILAKAIGKPLDNLCLYCWS